MNEVCRGAVPSQACALCIKKNLRPGACALTWMNLAGMQLRAAHRMEVGDGEGHLASARQITGCRGVKVVIAHLTLQLLLQDDRREVSSRHESGGAAANQRRGRTGDESAADIDRMSAGRERKRKRDTPV